jgi:hypothetical protein
VNFLNLGLGELLGLITAISAGITVLYLLDRSKKKHLVATLRFWTAAGSRTELKHRRRIQQPWSLLLQLLSMLLLLLAIAGPQFGVFDGPGRSHVVILDTSAWMGSVTAQGNLLDQAKSNAVAYVQSLPIRDRVMIVRADAVATPATPFESNRGLIETAIRESQPGSSALNLSRAFQFAERAQSLQNEAPGEIVFVGAGHVLPEEATLGQVPKNLRVIPSTTSTNNIGLRKVSLRRSRTAPETWEIFVSVHNYDSRPRNVALDVRYVGAPAGARQLSLPPNADVQAAFTYKEKAGGWLEARLNINDAVPQDDRTVIEVPSQIQKAVVFSNDASLRPLFTANPELEVEFKPTAAYSPSIEANVIVLDGFAPPAPPKTNTIWIAPPASGSVIPVGRTLSNVPLEQWSQDNTLGAGLYTRDVTLASTETFTPAAGDKTIASVKGGPVVVARDGPVKHVALGFHPTQGAMQYEVATPLLIANILRWMTPGASRHEIEAGAVGTITVPLPANTDGAGIHVVNEDGEELPFRLANGALNFFAGSPGNVRVQLRDRELLYSLSLPDLAEALWKPAANVARGIPKKTFSPAATEIWPWLAILGAIGLIADWILYERNRRARLILKALCIIAIIVALTKPSTILPESKLGVAVLVDNSASTSQADRDHAKALSEQLTGAHGRNTMLTIPFAAANPRATDIETAVQEAVASLPAGRIPRIALISDGLENHGSLSRAAWQAKQLGIPIDTFALAGRTKPALRIESVSIPAVAFTGEQFPIDLNVSAPSATTAEVELSAEGQSLGKSQVTLDAGENPVRLHAGIDTAGALDLTIGIRPQNSAELRFDQTVTLRKPKVLLLSGDKPEDDQHLTGILQTSMFHVEHSNDVGRALSDYQLVIFNNWDLESLPEQSKNDLEEFVRQGGGLLVIGGDRNVYVERKGPEDALTRALPAKLAPPRSPEGTGVILIVDKSSSMEGRKMELARLAAIGAVNNLRPIDQVGVLMFDNTFEWAVPVRLAQDKAFITGRIAGIRPDGGTQIAPALAEAFSRMKPVEATSRHIVLLTDGISEEGNSFATAAAAKDAKVTISTVGIGQDVNKQYLEKVAQAAEGKSYFVLDLNQLEQILIKDVMEHTGTTAVERPLAPEVAKQVEVLNEVGMESAPELKGYVRFISKPTADTLLTIDKKDPLLTRWQYGLGRSAVFASDAKPRWAADWIKWKGFDKFWTNLMRDLLPRTTDGEATLTFDSANGELVATYRLGRGVREPSTVPPVFAFGPGGFQQPIPVKKIAAGTYQGRLAIGQRQGLFRVLPAQESRAFPEIGLYRPEAELTEYGSNALLLKQVAQFTGGKFEPKPEEVFTGTGKTIPTTLMLWPGLLGLAVLLSLIELVMRKWKGVFGARRA